MTAIKQKKYACQHRGMVIGKTRSNTVNQPNGHDIVRFEMGHAPTQRARRAQRSAAPAGRFRRGHGGRPRPRRRRRRDGEGETTREPRSRQVVASSSLQNRKTRQDAYLKSRTWTRLLQTPMETTLYPTVDDAIINGQTKCVSLGVCSRRFQNIFLLEISLKKFLFFLKKKKNSLGT